MTSKFTVTKFIHEAGCGKSTGWDGAHLDGLHKTGHPMRVSISRQMDDPTFVRFESSVDGSYHVTGTIPSVPKDSLANTFNLFWGHAYNAPSAYREALT